MRIFQPTISGSLIQSGSSIINGSLNVSSGITGSLLGTASYANTALTASYTPNAITTASVSLNTLTFTKDNGSTFNLTVNTGSGGGGVTSITAGTGINVDQPTGNVTISSTAGLPGGAHYDIQVNDGANGFTGNSNFTYDVNDAISYIAATDFGTIYVDSGIAGRFSTKNNVNQPADESATPRIFATDLIPWTIQISSATSATVISFEINTGTQTTLRVTGFKCDYCLTVKNGSDYFSGTRVGTIMCAWDYDNIYTPVLVDSSISGDMTENRAHIPVFVMSRVSNKAILNLDNTGTANNIVFTGLFTVFTNK